MAPHTVRIVLYKQPSYIFSLIFTADTPQQQYYTYLVILPMAEYISLNLVVLYLPPDDLDCAWPNYNMYTNRAALVH